MREEELNEKKKKMAMIVSSGTMDKLYSVMMLASAASSMDVEVHLFFTFWGLNALKKGGIDKAELPSNVGISTDMLKGRLKELKIPTLSELLAMCKESGNVKIYACSSTMEIMNVKKEDLIPEVDEIAGAAAFTGIALDSNVSLFV